MRRLKLGSGAVAFEIEGEADRLRSLDPNDLLKRWPKEVVDNYRRYMKESLTLTDQDCALASDSDEESRMF